MTQADRVLEAMRGAPKRVSEIVALTGIRSAQAARACAELVDKGALTRLTGGRGKPCIYALRADGNAYTAALKGDAMRALEAQYVEARRGGKMARQAAAELGLTPTSSLTFELAFRAQTTSASARDSSCPKFADDDRHLAALGRPYPVMPSLADLQGARA